MNILETKNLVKTFDGVHAIESISLHFEKGKVTSVIGPNGSGKTTLINVLSGMLPMDGGRVVIGGTEISSIAPAAVPQFGITRTFQDIRLFEQMTVLDNVLVVLTERKIRAAFFERHGTKHLDQAEVVLKKVGLWEKRNALAYNLSYGQRKLLEIARAVAMDAEIILFDEPFAGLFREMIKIIVGLIHELRAAGKTIILVEHNMDLIRELSDYCIVMDSGRLLTEGFPSEVLARRDVIEAYLGE